MVKQIKIVLFSLLLLAVLIISILAGRKYKANENFLEDNKRRYDSLLIKYEELENLHILETKYRKEQYKKDSLLILKQAKLLKKDSVIIQQQKEAVHKYKNYTSHQLLNALDSLYKEQ